MFSYLDQPNTSTSTYTSSSIQDTELYLSLLRLIQPSTILLFALLSLTFPFIKSTFNRVLNPRNSNQFPSDQDESASSTSIPEPTPVVIPLKTRRRFLTQALLLTASSTYFLSGVLIILRAVLPGDRIWTPDLPTYFYLDFQSLIGLIAWITLALACLIEEKQRGIQLYGRGKIVFSILVGSLTDILILVLQFQLMRELGKEEDGLKNRWNLGQVLLIFSRLILIYPLLLIAISWDKTKYVRADQLARAQSQSIISNNRNSSSNLEAQQQQAQSSTETSNLLHPNSAAEGYGSTGTSTPTSTSNNKGKGKASQASTAGTGTRSPAQDANASMGLSVQAAPPAPTMKVFAQRLKVLFPYLWPSESPKLQGLAAFCVLCLIAGRFVNLLVPLTLGKIVDSLATTNSNLGFFKAMADGAKGWLANADLWTLIFFYAGLKSLQGSGGLLTVIQNFAWLPVEQYSDRQMSMMAFSHLLNLSMAFHSKRKTGEVLRILDRGAAINNFFQYLIFSVIPIFVDIGIAMIYLTRTFSWMVGGSLFVVMYFYTYSSVKLTTWRTTLRRLSNNKDSICRAINTDCLLNYETIKHSANESYEQERYRAALLDYQVAEYQVLASLNVLNLIQTLIISVGTLATTLMVASSVSRGITSPSSFVIFITYLQQVYGPLSMLGTLYRVVQQNLVDTDKLMALLEEDVDVKDLPGAKDLVITDGIIEFRDVHFSYDGRVPALSGVSFKTDKASKFAICGETGSGKSTLFRLLFRFYDVQSGQILIDGQDIRHVTQKSLRKAVGIVPQDPSLFNSDIKHNILYGDVSASDDQVEAAAAAAQILDKIHGFPDGFKTLVGERGVKLSGGEKQRVAIARTILKNPPILCLDEATSALDSQTEKQLLTALGTVLEGRNSITIAHRLATIINSDQILVMDQGRVIESGSHAELKDKNGVYAAMWFQQIKTQKEQEASAKEQEEQKATAEAEAASIKPTIETVADSKQKDDEEQSTSPTAPQGFLGVVPPSMTGETNPLPQELESSKPEEQEESESSTPTPPKEVSNAASVTKSPNEVSSFKFPSPTSPEVDTLTPLPDQEEAVESTSRIPTSISDSTQGGDASIISEEGGASPSTPRSNSFRKRITSLINRRTPSTSSVSAESQARAASASQQSHQVESSEAASTLSPGREREVSQAGSEAPSVTEGASTNGKKKKNKNKKKKGNGNKSHS